MGALLAGMALVGSCALREAGPVQLEDRYVRISDVIAAGCATVENSPGVGETKLASVPDYALSRRISVEGLTQLVHRRLPDLDIRIEPADQAQYFEFVAAPPPVTDEETACGRLKQSVTAKVALDHSMLEPVACGTQIQAPSIHYDRQSGVVRASETLEAGTYLGRLSLPATPFPDTGGLLTLRSTVGPVIVEREVKALQPAPSGGRLFVQDAEGEVFAAPFVEATELELGR